VSERPRNRPRGAVRQPFNARLPVELANELRAVAITEQATTGQCVEDALRAWLDAKYADRPGLRPLVEQILRLWAREEPAT
jgi:ribose 5-phosphate isomerase RpiB